MQTGVLIGFNTAKEGAFELAGKISSILRENGMRPLVWGTDSVFADQIGADSASTPAEGAFLVTVGGDGTLIKWGKIVAKYEIPLLGVNMGRLGFMATLEPHEIDRIPGILGGDFSVSRRMMLECKVLREGEEIFSQSVVNDVTLSRSSLSKLPEFVVFCGEAEVSRVRADGVILSTPTGSTAYSLSAGGPILAPDLECIEFTALCPHTLFNRPMIFSDKQTISVNVRHYQNSKATFSVDGSVGVPFLEGDVLQLTRCGDCLRIISVGEGFYGAVHNKLMTPMK